MGHSEKAGLHEEDTSLPPILLHLTQKIVVASSQLNPLPLCSGLPPGPDVPLSHSRAHSLFPEGTPQDIVGEQIGSTRHLAATSSLPPHLNSHGRLSTAQEPPKRCAKSHPLSVQTQGDLVSQVHTAEPTHSWPSTHPLPTGSIPMSPATQDQAPLDPRKNARHRTRPRRFLSWPAFQSSQPIWTRLNTDPQAASKQPRRPRARPGGAAWGLGPFAQSKLPRLDSPIRPKLPDLELNRPVHPDHLQQLQEQGEPESWTRS